MRISTVSLASAVLFSLPSLASAEISFLLEMDTLRDQAGNAVDIATSSWILVASTLDADFGPVGPGNIGPSDFIGSDDQIVARGTFWFVDGTIQSNPTGLTLGGDWDANDPLALVWFPEGGDSRSTAAASDAYGFYTSSLGEGASDPWVTPADGASNYKLEIKTTDAGIFGAGPVDPASVFAGNLVIPEPSTSILGLLSIALIIRRRR